MRAVELGMAASPAARPRKLLANLVETLERTKAEAGVVDGGATDFKSCKRFALSVYARADRGDRARPPNAVPTRAHVEAFSAAGTFLKALEHFEPLGDARAKTSETEDLATRKRYAEWRAWDLATAAREGRGASPVDEPGGEKARATEEDGGRRREERAVFFDAANETTLTTFTVSARKGEPSDAVESSRQPPTTPLPAPSPPSCTSLSPRGPRARPPRREEETEEIKKQSPRGGSARGERWRPDWGGGGPHAIGASVLYSTGGVPREGEEKQNEGATSPPDARFGGFALARVVAADHSLDPPAYVVEVDGAERSTEAARLAPPPDPREARSGSGVLEETAARVTGGGDDRGRGVKGDEGPATNESDERATNVAATTEEDRATNVAAVRTAEDAARSVSRASAFAEARALAMRAADSLDPSSGDARTAATCLRRALEALDARDE